MTTSITKPTHAGVGAAAGSSSVVPAVLIGGAILVGLAAVIALGTRDRGKTVDHEAMELFPPMRYEEVHGAVRRTRQSQTAAYRNAVGRCYYKVLREQHTPEDAARRAKHDVRHSSGWLNEFAREGRSVKTGCNFLQGHIRMSGKRVARSRSATR